MPPNPRGKKTATPTMDADGDEQLRRITVNLKARDIKRIDKLIEETGLSASDILREALGTHSFVVEVRRKGQKILIEDDTATREVFFPE